MKQRTVLSTMMLLAATSLGNATDAEMPEIKSGQLLTVSVSGNLARTVRDLAGRDGGPAWFGYSVPANDDDTTICCGDWGKKGWKNDPCCGVCTLESERGYNMISTNGRKGSLALESPGSVVILVRLAEGSVDRVRAASPDCRLDVASRPFYWLTGVDEASSIAWLASLLEQGRPRSGRRDSTGETIMAIAIHRDAAADAVLEKLASKGHSSEEREQATFWMGNARGRRGYEALKRMMREEQSSAMKEKIIFALSQSRIPEATDVIIDAARHDDDSDVRGQALFWLAQQAAERAEGVIAEAIEHDPETEVKKKAVFALSQLPSDRAVPLLIDVARTNRNPAVRKEAIFWLGQSGDERALDFIEEILEAPSRKGI